MSLRKHSMKRLPLLSQRCKKNNWVGENTFDPLLVSERRVRSGPKRAAAQDAGGGPAHRPLSFTSYFLGLLYGTPFVFCASSRGVSRFT
jgi:hypothetical protein